MMLLIMPGGVMLFPVVFFMAVMSLVENVLHGFILLHSVVLVADYWNVPCYSVVACCYTVAQCLVIIGSCRAPHHHCNGISTIGYTVHNMPRLIMKAVCMCSLHCRLRCWDLYVTVAS